MKMSTDAIDQAIAGLDAQGRTAEDIAGMLAGAMRVKPADLVAVLLEHQQAKFRADTVPLFTAVGPVGGVDMANGGRPFTAGPEILAIRSAVDRGVSFMIEALAGSGKTTNMVEAARRMVETDPAHRILAVAFNRSTSETLAKRMPKGTICSTMHGLAWREIVRVRGWGGQNQRLDAQRLPTRSAACIATLSPAPADTEACARDLRTAWSLARSTMTDPRDVVAVRDMLAGHGACVGADGRIHALVADLESRLRDDRGTISFDEMLTAIVDDDIAMPPFDTIIVDEAQDLNALQIEILARIPHRRIIVVGDRHQAIYAWRGADHAAMDRIAARLGIGERHPLSTTWRCPKAVVREASGHVPSIRAAPDAPEGAVIRRGPGLAGVTIAALRAGDLVLGRTNASVVAMALRIAGTRRDVKVGILGDDQSEQVQAMLRQHQGEDPVEAGKRISERAEREAERLERDGLVAAAMAVRDRAGTAAALLADGGSVKDAVGLCRSMFVREPSPSVILHATIHKAKGLEAPTVVLLDAGRIPHPRILATGSAALIAQERNLLYVAVTRAMSCLVYQETETT